MKYRIMTFCVLLIAVFLTSAQHNVAASQQDCASWDRDFFGNCPDDQGGFDFWGSGDDEYCSILDRNIYGECLNGQGGNSGGFGDFFGGSDRLEDLSCENFEAVFSGFSMILVLSGGTDGQLFEKMLLPFGAQFCFMERQYDRAISLYNRAIELYSRDGSSAAVGMLRNDMGAAYLGMGAYDHALEQFQRAYDMLHDEIRFRGVPLTNIGLAYTYQGKFQQAFMAYEQARADLEGLDNRVWLAVNYANTDLAYHLLADRAVTPTLGEPDIEQAFEYYQQALNLLRAEQGGG